MTESVSIDAILTEWERDCVVDPLKIDASSLAIARLHAKYLRYLVVFRRARRDLLRRRAAARLSTREFYLGNGTPEDYKQRPHHRRVVKSEVEAWVDADESVSSIEASLETADIGIEAIKSILSQVKDRSFQLRNALEYQKFLQGG